MNQSPSRSSTRAGLRGAKEVAADLHISKSSVRRCAKKAKAEGGGGTMASPAAEASPAPIASPAAH